MMFCETMLWLCLLRDCNVMFCETMTEEVMHKYLVVDMILFL